MYALAVGILGSREYPSLADVRTCVRDLRAQHGPCRIVTGRSRGPQREAVRAAKRCRLPVTQFVGLSDGLEIQHIIAKSDKLVAFWDGHSVRTRRAIVLALAAGKPVVVMRPVS